MDTKHLIICCVLLVGCFVLSAKTSRADALYLVILNTAPLSGHPAGPFSLNFQLSDGGGTATNVVTLTDFQFGGDISHCYKWHLSQYRSVRHWRSPRLSFQSTYQ